ncbi:unnamed protein product [Linum trigynum]|uniref:Uncharacterized protein n=1 Tax=Linum trigynum TaxID=586398 RepID=A0AAV2D652_9ROSI
MHQADKTSSTNPDGGTIPPRANRSPLPVAPSKRRHQRRSVGRWRKQRKEHFCLQAHLAVSDAIRLHLRNTMTCKVRQGVD